MPDAAIYARVSLPSQHISTQLLPLRELAVKRGFQVVAEYQDNGFSGAKARRPGLDASMLAAADSPSCSWRLSTGLPGARGISYRSLTSLTLLASSSFLRGRLSTRGGRWGGFFSL
jgi:hypothetical protein